MAIHKQILLPINKFLNINKNVYGKQICSIKITPQNDQYSYLQLDEQTNKTNIIKIKDDFDNNLKYSLEQDENGDFDLKILFYKSYRGQNQSYVIIYFQDTLINFVTPPQDLLFDFQKNNLFKEMQDISYDFKQQDFKSEFDNLFDIIGYEDNVNIYTGQETSSTRPAGINIVNNGYNNTYSILTSKIQFGSFYDGMLIEIDFFEIDEYDDQVFLFLKSFNNESIIVRFERHHEYKHLYFDFLYQGDFYSWFQDDKSEKITIFEEESNTFQIRVHQDRLSFYCNNKFLKTINVNPSEFILDNLFFQVGLINKFSLNSSLYLQGLRIYSIYKQDVGYNDDYNDMFVNYILNDDDYEIIDFSNFKEFETPTKLQLDSTQLPYFIDLDDYYGESYIDIQFKNYFLIFSKRVSILNKVLYDKQNFEDIENFIWRQLTPKFVREQSYENNTYLWTELVHVMQDFVQKLDTLGKKFGDLFHPFQTDMYLKKTLYFRFKSLNILQDYFDMVENNHQIFTLLSLEFFKEVLEYYVDRGKVEQINIIFNNQFKNLSQSLELFLFYFSQNGDIQILPYQYPTKLKEFNMFVRNGGLKQIFEQQKIQLYDKNKIYFKSLEKELFKSYKHKRMMSDDFNLHNTIEEIVDNLLKNQVYRHIIVLFDKTSLQINDFKDSLIKFFDFIKQEYLPQNMDFIFLENTIVYNDPENEGVFDFSQLRFNYLDEPELFFSSIKQNKIQQGTLQKDIYKDNNIYIQSGFELVI